MVGFLPVSDPRLRGTIAAIERELLRGGLVMRYDTGDAGRPAARRGRLPGLQLLAGRRLYPDRARRGCRAAVSPAVSLCNDLGLLARNMIPARNAWSANFPQAFSHMALVNTAHNIAHVTKPCEQRSGNTRLAEAAE